MANNKRIIIVTILLLCVGFAAVATNLTLNGIGLFGTNIDDFDVYFSSAILDGVDLTEEIISEDRLSITYEASDLTFINDKSELIYEVTNASKNYDADVKVNCTDVGEEVTIKVTPSNQIIGSTEIKTGKIEIELNKTVVDERELTFTCTLDVTAQERNSLGTNNVKGSKDYILSGYFLDENDEIVSNANIVVFSNTPHYTTTNSKGYFYVSGLEKGSHELYYVNDTLDNIKSMTKEEIISNSISSANFTTSSDNIELSNSYKIETSIIKLHNTYCKELIGETWEFDYLEGAQNFVVPCDGEYKIELWGASGANYSHYSSSASVNKTGGKGGYTAGNIMMNEDENYLIFTGGAASGRNPGYNGGTIGGSYSTTNGTWTYAGGGGATDIRYFEKEIDYINTSEAGILARIMVAGGGGGAGWYENGYPGGTFTKTGTSLFTTSEYTYSGGSGGGYIGGARKSTDHAGYGGNSYISGYYNNVPNASGVIDEYHSSGKVFYDISSEEGNNSGNGKAKITYLDTNSNYEEQTVFEYNTDGNYDLFEVKNSGIYKVELWGASGYGYWYSGNSGSVSRTGGLGGYTSGYIEMKKGEKYVLFVGSAGGRKTAGYNGAGSGGEYTSAETWTYAGGGGSTDLRYFVNNEIDTSNGSEKGTLSRIMIAGGGGGAAWYGNGSVGGLITSSTATNFYSGINSPTGGGGGSGYYGGTGGTTDRPGNGGISFISGHNGCDAVAETSTLSNIIHTGQANHYSGKIFTNTVLLSGSEEMPTQDGTSTMTGNSGNGFARISLISEN